MNAGEFPEADLARAAEDSADFPDIGDLAAAIDEIVAAQDAFLASLSDEDGERRDRAFDRCRDLQKQIARAQEAIHA